ncbi:hypothetical protein R1sor_010141 [Riccia sorocarpa]|uniref:Uncharacterized protein n=1 Tax=Riccia sorocarpa TaxID=122646 RepID=A0ABD3I143_9MARC
MVRKDVRRTILWKEGEELLETILVTILHRTTTCRVRRPQPRRKKEQSTDEEEEQLRKFLEETTVRGGRSLERLERRYENNGSEEGISRDLSISAEGNNAGNADRGLNGEIVQGRQPREKEAHECRRREEEIQQILHTMENFNIRQNQHEERYREPTPDWLNEAQFSAADNSVYALPDETHLEAEKIKFLVVVLTPDYEVIASSSLGRRRGVALLYRKDIKLLQSERDDQGRVIWRRFKTEDHEFSIASIYAPNESADRIVFWRYLRAMLPPGQWLLAVDWNAVLTSKDSSSKTNIQSDAEAAEFRALCMQLGVEDAKELLEKRQGPKYTMVQARGGKITWSRLNRVWFKRRRDRTTIKKLKTEDGGVLEDPNLINKELLGYYSKLHTAQDENPQQQLQTVTILGNLRNTVTREQNTLLNELKRRSGFSPQANLPAQMT